MQRTNINLIIVFSISLAYIALITFQPSLQFMPDSVVWFMDKQRLLELLLLVFILLHSAQSSINKSNAIPVSRPIRLALIGLLIFSCFSISVAYRPRHAMLEASVFAALAYLALFIAQLHKKNQDLLIKRLSYIIWASILLYMVSFYAGYITATIVRKPLHWPLPFVGFSNIRSFNQYQLWTLGFILLPLLCFEIKKSTRVLLHIALTAWWVLLFYSASRGVLIAWLVSMHLTALVYQKLSWPFLRLQLSNIITGFIGYQLLFKLTPAVNESILITQTVTRQTTNDRLALWDQAIIMVKSSPILGVGPMHYAWFNKTNGHPHNSVLQLAAEWGLPATCIILGIFCYGFYCWFRAFGKKQLQAASRLESNLAIIMFFTITANAAYSLVDGVIVMPISQVLMFTMIGLMLGQYVTANAIEANYQARFRPVIAGVLLVVVACSAYPEIKQGFSGDRKGFSMGHTAIGPRFWRETK